MATTDAVLDPPVIVETGVNPIGTVVWLHGLGADGHDFEPVVPELNLPADMPLRFVFPNAPHRSVTWNNGYVMRAWYDMAVTEKGVWQDVDDLHESIRIVHRLIDQEIDRGIPAARVVLAGFSQGGAISIHAGLRFDRTLAGIASLSAPSFDLDALRGAISEANKGTPLFLAHGDRDTVVPLVMGQQTQRFTVEAGLTPEWRIYPMAHGVCGAEIADISRWLVRVMGR